MNIWEHSKLSVRKFGGKELDYFDIHKFIDSSKLFYYHAKHRLLLHNLYGIELCISKFGDLILNSENRRILVRDIAAEHLKEDLSGKIPSLYDWLKDFENEIGGKIKLPEISTPEIRDFVFHPLHKTGLKSSTLITYSNFGVYLIKEIIGKEQANQLHNYLSIENNISFLLDNFRFSQTWQFTPDEHEIEWLKKQKHE